MSIEGSKVKIDLASIASEHVQNTGSVNSLDRGKGVQRPVEDTQDDVRLGNSLSRLANLGAELQTVPEVRSEKVNDLRAAILEGRYSVSAGDVAASMLSDMHGRNKK